MVHFSRTSPGHFCRALQTTVAILRKLEAMGHEIGLHFEAMNVGRALKLDPPDLMRREKLVLETVLGHAVASCSEHRELSGVVHRTPVYDTSHDPKAAGFSVYAMDGKWTKEMKYLSDSNANWREGDLHEHLGKHDRFQILVHADWWFEDDLLLKGPYVHGTQG